MRSSFCHDSFIIKPDFRLVEIGCICRQKSCLVWEEDIAGKEEMLVSIFVKYSSMWFLKVRIKYTSLHDNKMLDLS